MLPAGIVNHPEPPGITRHSVIETWLAELGFSEQTVRALTQEIIELVTVKALEEHGARTRTPNGIRPYVLTQPRAQEPKAAEYANPGYEVKFTYGGKLTCRGCRQRIGRGEYAAINNYRAACLNDECIREASR